MSQAQSLVSRFERAVDAIVNGDLDVLARTLRDDPDLVHARSPREHRSTLLHYVSANGVEDYRQKTPPNIVEIRKLLLDAGADANAESDAYGGHSTTLGLAATSYWPEAAGVQIPLLELLIERGARIDGKDSGARSTVVACLHNGRGKAAEFLVTRGAHLDLEGAAGVGRLDRVEALFADAPEQQKLLGMAWACEFGKHEVVEFLLRNGMEAAANLLRGETALHWAAFGAHGQVVETLLAHGAPIAALDERFSGTPLGWALHGWMESGREAYYDVIAQLVRAGAKPGEDWLSATDRRSDPRLQAALRGEA